MQKGHLVSAWELPHPQCDTVLSCHHCLVHQTGLQLMPRAARSGRRETLCVHHQPVAWHHPTGRGRASEGRQSMDSICPQAQGLRADLSFPLPVVPALTPRTGIVPFSWKVSNDSDWQPEGSQASRVQGTNQSPQRTEAHTARGQVCERHPEEADISRQ